MSLRVRDRLLIATSELMRRHGVAGTAVSEILTRSGVSRRSIYLNFPGGKLELVDEATRASGEELTKALDAVLATEDPLTEFTQMWAALLTETDFDAGCPIVAAALARSEAPQAADQAGSIFGSWRDRIAQLLVDQGIEPGVAESLAVTILSAVEGAVVIAQAQRSTQPVDEVGVRLAELVRLHMRE